ISKVRDDLAYPKKKKVPIPQYPQGAASSFHFAGGTLCFFKGIKNIRCCQEVSRDGDCSIFGG
ncbi:hypothetical protein KAS10_03235, partial [Candidatus Aerophobetes bacterium]|nr:hypothetical protein [Candidatus Aerophobetes bacterium]